MNKEQIAERAKKRASMFDKWKKEDQVKAWEKKRAVELQLEKEDRLRVERQLEAQRAEANKYRERRDSLNRQESAVGKQGGDK